MVVAWGLELGDTMKNVKWVVCSIIDYEWLIGLDSFLEWVVLGVGFDVSEGIEDPMSMKVYELILFIH